MFHDVLELNGEHLDIRGFAGVVKEHETALVRAVVSQPPPDRPVGAMISTADSIIVSGEVELQHRAYVWRFLQKLRRGLNVLLAETGHFRFRAKPENGAKLRPGRAWAHAWVMFTDTSGNVRTSEWQQWVVIKEKGALHPPQPGMLCHALQLNDALAAAARNGHSPQPAPDPETAERQNATLKLLENLQPNILRPHVRTYLKVIFVQVREGAEDDARTALHTIADPKQGLMKNAWEHFQEVDAHRKRVAAKQDPVASVFVGIGLSATGYARLDHARPQGLGSMRDDRGRLNDPPYTDRYDQLIDAVVLIGGSDEAERDTRYEAVLTELEKGFKVIKEETGKSLSTGREQFGFVDGRSQPLFVEEDAEYERFHTDGTRVWSPTAAMTTVILPDRGVHEPHCFGSFLVFRKLAQDTKGFTDQATAIARQLWHAGSPGATPTPDQIEQAAAMIVGRFRDGTPLALERGPRAPLNPEPEPQEPEVELKRGPGSNEPPNDFTYWDNGDGAKCPLSAHIRVMNSRQGSADSAPILARRGQAYTDENGSGLLFMALVSDIDGQFVLRQQLANGHDENKKASPVDGLIGQPAGAATLQLSATWGGAKPANPESCPFASSVTTLGGEYFFLPSIPFLQQL
jgi:deferrochelatase/peroxidase EfeB